MKIEWLISDVAPVWSPDRAEHAIWGVILDGRFLANSGHICSRGVTLWCKNPLFHKTIHGPGATAWCKIPLLSPNNFSEGDYENIMVGYRWNTCRVPWQGKTCYFRNDFGWALSWSIQAIFLVGEVFCDIITTPWTLKTLLRAIYWKKSGWLPTNVTAFGSPDKAESAIWGVILDFFANSGRICDRGASLWWWNPILSLNKFT